MAVTGPRLEGFVVAHYPKPKEPAVARDRCPAGGDAAHFYKFRSDAQRALDAIKDPDVRKRAKVLPAVIAVEES